MSACLEQVLREQRGAGFFTRYRALRRLAATLRGAYREEDQARLRRLLATSSVEELMETGRALTLSFWLLNLCEQRYFASAHSADERGGLLALFERLGRRGVPRSIVEAALEDLRLTLVLTAHPTEAMRWSVHESLERIDRLLDGGVAADDNEPELLRELTGLWQTEILRYRAPTPLDEVRHVVHTVEHVLVPAMVALPERLSRAFAAAYSGEPPVDLRPLELGSWVGGDRDGNPFVTAGVTEAALGMYRTAMLDRYLAEIPPLVQELTLSARRTPVSTALRTSIERDLKTLPALRPLVGQHNPEELYRTKLNGIALRLEHSKAEVREERAAGTLGGFESAFALRHELELIVQSLKEHGSERLASGRLARWLRMVDIFGLQLAVLDVRQHQGRHREAREELIVPAEGPIDSLSLDRQQSFLEELILSDTLLPTPVHSEEAEEVMATLRGVLAAQERFGPDCVRDLVISDAGSEIPVLELLLLARHAGLVRLGADGTLESSVDLVPLFESIAALDAAPGSMRRLYESEAYRSQLAARSSRQQIMLGYSDSMKDGGYMAACWGLYRVQRELAAQGREYGIRIEFFHGRGGTIARGGGPTHRAILAEPPGSVMGRIKLTEQGEVISHKYDSIPSAVHHLDQSLSAALEASLPLDALPGRGAVPGVWRETMTELAELSRRAYRELVYETPGFAEALYAMTPLEEISELQIGSRPARRSATTRVEDLRAISWTFAWNQARVLLPAWYGGGTALAGLLDAGEREELVARLRRMYQRWPFFRTVIDNLQLVLAKTDLHIASIYTELAGTPIAAQVLQRLEHEYELIVEGVLEIVDSPRLLANDEELAQSLELRGPGLDVLGYIQTELLQRKRQGNAPDPHELTQAIQLTINGIAAGLRNTG